MADTKLNQRAAKSEAPNQNEAFILKYKNAIIGCVAVILIAVAGYFVYNSFTSNKQTEASTAMAKAQEYFQMGIMNDDADMLSLALNGDSTNAGFLAVAEDYSSTKAGNLANLYAGICFAELDSMSMAEEYLAKFDAKDDQMVSPLALGRLGNIKAAQGKLDEAVELLVKGANKADNNTVSPLLLIQAGEILESQGKKEEALKLYQQVKDNYYEWQQYNQYMQGFNGIDNYIERCK